MTYVGNGENVRITHRQLNYAINLGRSLGMNSKDLNEESVKIFGAKIVFLSVRAASSFIGHLKSQMA